MDIHELGENEKISREPPGVLRKSSQTVLTIRYGNQTDLETRAWGR